MVVEDGHSQMQKKFSRFHPQSMVYTALNVYNKYIIGIYNRKWYMVSICAFTTQMHTHAHEHEKEH